MKLFFKNNILLGILWTLNQTIQRWITELSISTIVSAEQSLWLTSVKSPFIANVVLWDVFFFIAITSLHVQNCHF